MDNIRPWFKLKSVPGVGNLLGKRLLDRFESAQRVFQASGEELLQVEGMTERLAMTIKKHKMPAKVEAELALVSKKGYQIVTLNDKNYPHE